MSDDPRPKRLRDPVHGYVNIPGELTNLVESPYLQRLRNISQNSRAVAAYPGLNGSRFEHALGTMEFSAQAWRNAWRNIWPAASKNGRKSDSTHLQMQDHFREDVEKALKASRRRAAGTYPADPYLDEVFPANPNRKQQVAWREEFPHILEVSVAAVGLLHDVGHPPFSHVLEPAFEAYAEPILGRETLRRLRKQERNVGPGHAQFHELAGGEIVWRILNTPEITSSFSTTVVWEIYTSRKGNAWSAAIHSLIDGEIDVDRLDYICRDAKRAGVEYHAIDTSRLLNSIELHADRGSADAKKGRSRGWLVGIGQHGISAVESLLMQRDQSYRWMIFHSKALLADTALSQAFEMALGYETERNADLSWLDYLNHWDDIHRSYTVDDHAVTTWLRAVLFRMCEEEHANCEIMLRLAHLWDAIDDRGVAAWRNYGEFLDAVGRDSNAIRAAMDSPTIDPGDASLRLMDGKVRRTANGQSHNGQPTNGSGQSLAQEFLLSIQDAWQGNPSAEIGGRPRIDREIQEYLNDNHGVVNGLPGMWLVAHRMKFKAIKTGEQPLSLWNGNSKEEFRSLSPIWDGLMQSNSRRPMIWAWFVPAPRSGPPSREDVQAIFVRALTVSIASQGSSN